jgi:transcriptional regulator with XRE-family HTH domain
MPRKTQSTIGFEEKLASVVQSERERRGWSPAELARRLTEAGAPMNQTSIWKIENGEPRRRIMLDEAVAIARVLNLSLYTMLEGRTVDAAVLEDVDRAAQHLNESSDLLAEMKARLPEIEKLQRSLLRELEKSLRDEKGRPRGKRQEKA